MPAVYLSPISNDQVVDSNGSPLVGGYWQVFLAGTSTPATTYTDSTGVTPQPTNITLDAAGRPANPIWLSGGIPVKFRLYSAAAVPLLTIDNVSGINDPAGVTAQDQWILYGAAPTYISGTSFSLVGDQTGIFQIGRRLKSSNSGGIRYSSITNSVYGAVTTVTVTNDSGTLDAGMSAVSYGLLSSVSSSVPTTIARSGANTDITSLNAPALGGATATTQTAGDNTTKVATTAFVRANDNPVGTIIDYAGTTAPTGYLACPLVATNISRTTYAALFAAIGTTWGAGDGLTTFGMPWFPADYVGVQANANVGTDTVGQNLAHTHTASDGGGFQTTSAGPAYGSSTTGSNSTATTSSNGGSANLAAGHRILKCVKT
jgi:hypothetical protein